VPHPPPGQAGACFGMLSLILVVAPAFASSRLALEFTAAPAFDSNAAQEAEEGGDIRPDLLLLTMGRAELQGRARDRLSYSATLEGGAKRFRREQAENALVLQFAGGLSGFLPEPLSLLVAIDSKDRRQPDGRRSYRAGGLSSGISWRLPAGFSLGSRVTGLAFWYVPDRDYDHEGWGGDLFLRWRGRGKQAHLAVRRLSLAFQGVRLNHEGQEDPAGERRADAVTRLDLEGSQLGRLVLSEGLFLQSTRSNSVGSANLRFGGRGSLGFALPGEVDLSLRASLLWARYDNPELAEGIADPTFGVEDEETRSSVGVALRRLLIGPLTAELRWARYFTIGAGPTYRRDTLLLGLRYGDDKL